MATHAPDPFRSTQYGTQRDKLAAYFDGTARKAWIDLTSDAKVSGIRATVRAGREEMRGILLSMLPTDMRRMKLLDAGCGTGALAVEAAFRGAEITAVDIAGGLVDIARERAPQFLGHGKIDWQAGDFLDADLGDFDHIVLMDSLIHYQLEDMVASLRALTERCSGSIAFTFAPHTKMLGAMHKAGKFFPRSDRSPAIVPIAEDRLRQALAQMDGWEIGRSQRVSSGFYTSHAMQLVRC
ncbi:magnesium protoporphyrin IX methyltransferase [Erythrobacter sp. HA6-11]